MSDQITAFFQSIADGNPQSILLAAAVYFVLACGYSCIYQLLLRRWPSTTGRLRYAQSEQFGWASVKTDQNYSNQALYEYQVDGTQHTGSKISAWTIVASHNARFLLQRQLNKLSPSPEGDITVYYNPRKPQNSLLIPPTTFGLFMTAVIGLLPAVLYFLKFG